MAKFLQPLVLSSITFWTHFLLFYPIEAQTSNTFANQAGYSTFELFKNTGLHPCPINTSTPTANTLVSREPRRGGGGGGSSASGGGTSTFIESTWVGDQANYCKYMIGTPIMIPTIPTQNAFTPWWPTFAAQFVSLFVTGISLWWTTRSVERDPDADDMKLPFTFWLFLPIDICRVIAWFVKVIRGFIDARQFAWVSAVLWLIPFNYVFLVQLLDAKRESLRATRDQGVMQMHHAGQHVPILSGEGKPWTPEYRTGPVESQYLVEDGTARKKSVLHWISVGFGVITIVQWGMSLTIVGLHFRYSWMDKLSHPTYVEISRAARYPSSVAVMPQTCLTWLQQSTGLIGSEILDLHMEQVIHTLIVALQFVMCTVVVVFRQGGRHRILGKLKLSALATLVTLVFPALGTGFWILGTVTFGNQDTWMTYTSNLTTTGGCTFGAVAMNRRWGYWDVQYERPYRIAMSALGVA